MSTRAAVIDERYARLSTAQHWVHAHGWDYTPELADRTMADIREKLALEPGNALLEVGCGSGALLDALLQPDQTGVGVDPCEPLLQQAQRFGVDLDRIRLLRGEAAKLPLPDAAFDRVLCYGVFLYFRDLRYADAALTEMCRVCKPGGTILVGDVPGYVERIRANWRIYGPRADTIAAVLNLPLLTPLRWLLAPLRPVYRGVQRLRGRRETADEGNLNYLWYGHSFFERWAMRNGCGIEILPQRIVGRDASSVRFDVRIRLPACGASGRRDSRVEN